MEYLPNDTNLNVTSQTKKKQEKFYKYRQYLVDQEVVRSITKCISMII